MPLTYTNSWPHPDHIPELALFTLACLAVARGHDGWFAAALIVASLNRETSAFLWSSSTPWRGRSRARMRRARWRLPRCGGPFTSACGSGAGGNPTTCGSWNETSTSSNCCRPPTTPTIAPTRGSASRSPCPSCLSRCAAVADNLLVSCTENSAGCARSFCCRARDFQYYREPNFHPNLAHSASGPNVHPRHAEKRRGGSLAFLPATRARERPMKLLTLRCARILAVLSLILAAGAWHAQAQLTSVGATNNGGTGGTRRRPQRRRLRQSARCLSPRLGRRSDASGSW